MNERRDAKSVPLLQTVPSSSTNPSSKQAISQLRSGLYFPSHNLQIIKLHVASSNQPLNKGTRSPMHASQTLVSIQINQLPGTLRWLITVLHKLVGAARNASPRVTSKHQSGFAGMSSGAEGGRKVRRAEPTMHQPGHALDIPWQSAQTETQSIEQWWNEMPVDKAAVHR